MNNQRLLEQFRSELRRRNLPSAYVERLLAEWEDHFADLLEERNLSMPTTRMSSADATELQLQLGSPADLAKFAAEQYHRRSFWGRHPLLTFLFGPLPLLAACWITSAIVLVAASRGLGYTIEHVFRGSLEPHEHLWMQSVMLALMCWYVLVVPPLAAAWLLCRIARRNSLDWRWPAIACLLLALAVGTLAISYDLATQPGNGRLAIGFGFSASPQWLLLKFVPKAALAWGIGLLLVRRAQHQAQATA